MRDRRHVSVRETTCRGAALLGDVAQVQEQLHLPETAVATRRHQRVVRLVDVEWLFVVLGAGVLRERLGLVEPDVVGAEERFD